MVHAPLLCPLANHLCLHLARESHRGRVGRLVGEAVRQHPAKDTVPEHHRRDYPKVALGAKHGAGLHRWSRSLQHQHKLARIIRRRLRRLPSNPRWCQAGNTAGLRMQGI